jgi:hypothetical protein
MINPSFQQLLYSQPIDTWLISNATEVDALVEEVYQSLLGSAREVAEENGQAGAMVRYRVRFFLL